MDKIKNFIARNHQKLIIISTIFLLIIGILNLFFVFVVRVTSNDECLWIPKGNEIYFEKVKVDGVTWKAGIRNGDQLISISKEKITDVFVAQSLLNKVKGGNMLIILLRKGVRKLKQRYM
jgi:membrane-associated protease RseP (regulator of RpoE activity)